MSTLPKTTETETTETTIFRPRLEQIRAEQKNAEEKEEDDINDEPLIIASGYENVDLDDLPPPPLDILPPDLQFIINEVAHGKNVPIEIILTNILALGSACIGGARGLIVDESSRWTELANLYLLVIAETGSGKSHAFDYIFHHLNVIEDQKKKQWQEARRQYEENMVLWKKTKNNDAPMPEKPKNIQYLLDDATIEAVVERLEDNERGLFWAVDEFSGFFQGLDRYAKNGAGEGKRKLLSAWDSRKIVATRKTKDGIADEKYITRGTIGMYGNIQPFLFQSAFNYNDIKQGWPQRFLFIRAEIDKPMIFPLPGISDKVDILLEKITRKLIGLDTVITEKGTVDAEYIKMSEEAKGAFTYFHNNLHLITFKTPDAGYTAKMIRSILRLALILHFLKWAISDEYSYEKEINIDTMNSAIALGNWLLVHTKYAMANLPAENGAIKKKKTESDDKCEKVFLQFIENTKDFLSEWRTAREIFEKGLRLPGKTVRSTGMWLQKRPEIIHEKRRNSGYYKLA